MRANIVLNGVAELAVEPLSVGVSELIASNSGDFDQMNGEERVAFHNTIILRVQRRLRLLRAPHSLLLLAVEIFVSLLMCQNNI